MPKHKDRSAVILLVDDDEADQITTRRSLAACKTHIDLFVANDGEEGLDYLHRRGKFEDPASSPWPDLILLDLNMPRMDGREFLAAIAKTDAFRSIPVVVLTTSDQEEDVVRSYQLGCNSYLAKPVGAENFTNVMLELERYWFGFALVPSGPQT